MLEREWLYGTDPRGMVDFMTGRPGAAYQGPGGIKVVKPPARKFDLAGCGFRRCCGDQFEWRPDTGWYENEEGLPFEEQENKPPEYSAQVWFPAREALYPRFAEVARCVFGNPFARVSRQWGESPLKTGLPKFIVGDDHVTPTVKSLAGQAHDRRLATGFLDTVVLQLLADALTDAGLPERLPCHACGGAGELHVQEERSAARDGVVRVIRTTEVCWHCGGDKTETHPVLYHLRPRQCWSCQGYGTHLGAGPDRGNPECTECSGTGLNNTLHVRGCWVLDLLLGLT